MTTCPELDLTGKFKAGDIVRYASGSTALAKLQTPHAGGWHAEHCLGGIIFVSESYPSMTRATDADVRSASTSQFYIWGEN